MQHAHICYVLLFPHTTWTSIEKFWILLVGGWLKRCPEFWENTGHRETKGNVNVCHQMAMMCVSLSSSERRQQFHTQWKPVRTMWWQAAAAQNPWMASESCKKQVCGLWHTVIEYVPHFDMVKVVAVALLNNIYWNNYFCICCIIPLQFNYKNRGFHHGSMCFLLNTVWFQTIFGKIMKIYIK